VRRLGPNRSGVEPLAAERHLVSQADMWCVDTLEVVPVELDFSSSGQGRRTARALHANGGCLINALELVEFDAVATQVHVCSSCGYSQCESGHWVALRRAGQFVVWIPAFAQLARENGSGRSIRLPFHSDARCAVLYPVGVARTSRASRWRPKCVGGATGYASRTRRGADHRMTRTTSCALSGVLRECDAGCAEVERLRSQRSRNRAAVG
jgi:hypothetical protein